MPTVIYKMATTGLPNGIRYFHCAINDEVWDKCAAYTGGQLNAVATYRKYYCTKPWQLKWNKSVDMAPIWYMPASRQVSVEKLETFQHSPVSIASYSPSDDFGLVSAI